MLLRLTFPFGTTIITCFIEKILVKDTSADCPNQPFTMSISHLITSKLRL
jgi:hypothetical protein